MKFSQKFDEKRFFFFQFLGIENITFLIGIKSKIHLNFRSENNNLAKIYKVPFWYQSIGLVQFHYLAYICGHSIWFLKMRHLKYPNSDIERKINDGTKFFHFEILNLKDQNQTHQISEKNYNLPFFKLKKLSKVKSTQV